MAQARSARAINQREKTRIRKLQYRPRKLLFMKLIRRAGKETSQSQAEGSTATKIAMPKFQKLNLFGKEFSVQVYATEMTRKTR